MRQLVTNLVLLTRVTSARTGLESQEATIGLEAALAPVPSLCKSGF